MTRWSYLLSDLTTPWVIDTNVPFTGVTFSDGIGDAGGSFTGTCPVGYRAFSRWPSNDGLRRVVWPCRDGVPVGAYLLTGMSAADAAATQIQWKGVRLDWILGQRVIRDTLKFLTVDQNDIFRDLIRYALGRSTLFASPNAQQVDMLPQAAVPWIALDDRRSGIQRTRQETEGNRDDGYPAAARKVVGAMLKNLTELQQGIEYRWLYRMVDDLPQMLLDTAGPTLKVGTPADYPSKLTFDYPGGNISTATWGFDATSMVTRAHIIGQQQDTAQPIGTATHNELWAQGYPLIDKVLSESSVQDQGVLDGKAAAQLSATSDAWAITLDGQRRPKFTAYGVGDYVTLRVKQGGQRRDRDMRITGWSVTPDDSGRTEKVTPSVEVSAWL